MQQILTEINSNAGLSASFIIAIVIVTLRTMQEKKGFATALMDIIVAGLAAPTVVWLVWKDAPFIVYGLIAAVLGRYPDLSNLSKVTLDRFIGKQGEK